MNPELRRNLWLDFGVRRLALTVVTVMAILAASQFEPSVGTYLFLLLVVLLGTRDAAVAVVGEIRDRTWDQQRLSAIGPWGMVWGKLAGATASRWVGGLLCLAPAVFAAGGAASPGNAIELVLTGAAGQVVAFFAAMVAVRRRSSHSRLETFAYQAVGIAAAVAVAHAALLAQDGVGETWWGIPTGGAALVLSVLAFVAWAWIGSVRLMRRELQIENGPSVWLGFLAFVAVYAAGWETFSDRLAYRLTEAAAALALVAYATVLLEPKDPVEHRRLRSLFAVSPLAVARALPAWIYAYLAAAAAGLALVAVLLAAGPGAPRAPWASDPAGGVLACLGFLTRDCALVLWLNMMRWRGADLIAAVAIGLSYGVIPLALGGEATPFLLPSFGAAAPLAAASAWLQAGAVVWLAVRASRRPVSAPGR